MQAMQDQGNFGAVPFLIREAMIDDMPACAAILNGWIDETQWMPRVHDADDVVRHYRESVFAHCGVLVAVQDGAPLAFCALNDGHIDALYAGPAGRGQGIGKALLDRAKTLSPNGLSLWTFVANGRAQQFYAREGFEEVRRTDGDNEERLPDILFQWQPDGRRDDA